MHLLLNHTFVPEILPPGFIAPGPTRIWLNVSNFAVPLKGHTNDLTDYTQQQWFNVRTAPPGCAQGAARACKPWPHAPAAHGSRRARYPSGPPGTGTRTR